MTPQQLARWRRLAVGLARSEPKTTRASVARHVEHAIKSIAWGEDVADICDWDGNGGKVYVCDRMDDYLYEEGLEIEVQDEDGWSHSERTPIGESVSACVRAAFDVAVHPSGGVIGFTVADLRRAFGGRLPQWVRAWFSPPLTNRTRGSARLWM